MATDQSPGAHDRAARSDPPANEPAGRFTSDAMLTAFDALAAPTVITRVADGVIVFANLALLSLLGWPADDVVGRTMIDIGFWARPERRAAMLERLAADGFVRDLEEEVSTRGGDKRIVLISVSQIDVDGEPSLLGHIHDITRHRRLEQQLREGEERFRQVTETLQQGFVLTEIEPPQVLYASPAVARVFGIELDELYRDPGAIERLIHSDDRACVLAARDEMTAASDFEYRIVRPDAETRWIRTRAEPARMVDGTVALVASVSEDVTDEHLLSLELRNSEERFRLLAENATDVIGRLAADQRIEYVSPACRAVYRYEPEEMVGRFGYEFIHPEDVAALSADFSPATGPAGVTTSTCRVLRGDGTYTWVEAKIRPLHDPDSGEIVEFHTVARDISERVHAEDDVHRAKEEAERANAAKSAFLSRMSHELRTPLHAILGFGQLLEGDDLQPDQREQLEQITHAGRHLLELINEVLDISRIEGGQLRMSLEPVAIAEVVAETLRILEPLAAARSIDLAQEPPPQEQLHVLADRQRLKQVLLNLLSNAIKYNREGGTARVSTTCPTEGTARVVVADSGVGMRRHDLARAFEAFERLGAETTDIEGTGLGLALVKRLVESMGGSVGVESELGSGTRFWLDLPVVAAPALHQRAPAHEPAGLAAVVRGEPRSVLYIEDNPSNIKLVEAILRARPEVTLLVAQQGSLGLELAREHRPALVLLDLNLPDYSGEEILQRLRGDPRTADIAVVIVSADATLGQVERLQGGGATAYLSKPFAVEQLLAVVDAPPSSRLALGEEPVRPRSRSAPPTPPGGPPAGEPAIEGPLDASSLDDLRSSHPDGRAVRELVEMFLEDSPTRLEALAAAAGDDDAEGVRREAHRWRGACGVTGAHRLADLLAAIETLARSGKVPEAGRLADVRSAYDEVRDALDPQRRR